MGTKNKKKASGDKERRVCLLALPGSQILDIAGPLEVFDTANRFIRLQDGNSAQVYTLELVAADQTRLIPCTCGVTLQGRKSYRQLTGSIDTLLVAGGTGVEKNNYDPVLLKWLRRRAVVVRRLGSICTGAFLLAGAGLLEGRNVTTHWNSCRELAERFPGVKVENAPIFVRDGNIYTSAGVTAGMDLALSLVEEDHGPSIALQVARQLVIFLRRPGSQAQFSTVLSLQGADRESLRKLQTWVVENIHQPLTVEIMADKAGMSPRNFARVFAQQIGTTPAKFVEKIRVEAARRRLEESPHRVAEIAIECGFKNTEALRSAFQRSLQISPKQYKERFQFQAAIKAC